MKNFIKYYYNLLISDFRKIEDYFIFDISGIKYKFLPFYGDFDKLYKNYVTLNRSNRYCHEIILNKDNQFITIYDSVPYLLIRYNKSINSKLKIEDITNYDTIIYGEFELNWKRLWEEKIDYYEYQISQLGFKYPMIRSSFSYYIGLSETAISLLNYVNTKNIRGYISHNRIKYNENINDFLDPTNIIIDSRIRDIGEFIKLNYINQSIKIDEVFKILSDINITYDESLLLLSRLIYPSYYFDTYDKIIQGKVREEKIEVYIRKNAYYEAFIKQIYKYLYNRFRIIEVEWLMN